MTRHCGANFVLFSQIVMLQTIWGLLPWYVAVGLVWFAVWFVWNTIKSLFFLKDVKNKIVLITGGASGIGKLTAERFLKLGSKVVIWDIGGLDKAVADLQQFGAVSGYQCDVTNADAVYDTAKKVQKEVGDVDILINNAGIVNGKEILQLDDKSIYRTFAVNTVSHFYIAKSFLPAMLQKNSGHIVTIASLAGVIGQPKMTDYCASKAAAIGFHESLHLELRSLGKTGVNTTCVCPFFINTGMFEGAKSTVPWLLPMLEQTYVADKIVHAIRVNQDRLIMPRIFYFLTAIKPLLPRWLEDTVGDRLGALELMKDFVGRTKQQ
eukprot:TRINITY_DN1019_c0_g1_i1.p1 TRINITY_DN1019_c0_g1~~TRINITY_DN1019_c0_g1_i1.p1  ORF type:complete len:322 (-),score=70.80 TRINITY_DN1019_c0_g1_i1:50-1015(-)